MAEGLLHRWGRSAEELVETVPGGLYVKVVPPPDTNKNTSWFQYPGIWTTYILIILFSWLAIVSAFRCDAGTAWTVVNLVHFAVTRLLCFFVVYLCCGWGVCRCDLRDGSAFATPSFPRFRFL